MGDRETWLFSGKYSNLDPEKGSSERLKDLVLKWFLTTQVPLILQDGDVPAWFHGFITRKQAEDLLKGAEFGCFLIRLNERSFGYILSYRGKDRCRHFVIGCQRNGRYAISGDTQTHQSLAELVSFYQKTDIEPFSEKLTVACPKDEETSVYDEISLDRQTSSKHGSMAGIPVQTSPSTTMTAKENVSSQPTKPGKKLWDQQKSLSKEKGDLSTEDPDDAPPLPARSNLLASQSFEEDLDDEDNFVEKNHLDNRSPEVLKNPSKGVTDDSLKPEGPDQANSSSCKKKTMPKQADRSHSKKFSLVEATRLETIYSEIGLDQDKASWLFPEPLSVQSSLAPSKKATLNSPSSTPPKLSPKLPSKPKASTELQGSQPLLVPYSTSPVMDKDPQKPNHAKTLPDSPKIATYGQIHKMKSQQSATSTGDKTSNTYEEVPLGWMKNVTPEPESEKLVKETYDQIFPKSGGSVAEHPYEKIPHLFTKGSPSKKHALAMENPYKQTPCGPAKGVEAKPSQKSDKPRRFFFTDKKTKF